MLHHRLTLLLMFTIMLMGVFLIGCATEPRQTNDRAMSRSPSARDASASYPPIEGERLLPLRPRDVRVRVTEGKDQGQVLAYRVERRDDHWLFTLEDRQRVHVRRDEAGRTLVFREDDFQENISIHYDPALVLLPARLDATGEPLPEQTVDVVVRHLDSGNVRDRGTCDYRLTQVWHLSGEGDDSSRERYGIVQQREIDLNLATATVEVEAVHVPDFGRIAWSVDRRTRVLGLLSSEQSEGYEVVDAAGEPRQP